MNMQRFTIYTAMILCFLTAPMCDAFTLPRSNNIVTNRQTANTHNFALHAGIGILEKPKELTKVNKKQSNKKESTTDNNGGWEVRIYNDGMNTREHVARCLVQVTGLSEVGAYQTMMQAHQNGVAVVGRWYYEQAEMYFEALKKKGIVCDLNPVDGDAK